VSIGVLTTIGETRAGARSPTGKVIDVKHLARLDTAATVTNNHLVVCTCCVMLVHHCTLLTVTISVMLVHHCTFSWTDWRAPWKNWISSTSVKLRKSLVKPVTRQNISSCSDLSPEIVMHDAFNVILWTSTDICVVHDDLRWKNRTTRYILPCHWLYEWFSSAANVCRYMRRAGRSGVKEPNNAL